MRGSIPWPRFPVFRVSLPESIGVNMCEESCYRAVPDGAAWARDIETGELGSIVVMRDGMLVLHLVDMWDRTINGKALIDAVDPDDVKFLCPLDAIYYDGASGKRIDAQASGVQA